MKNLLKITGGIAFAALVFTVSISKANANTAETAVDNISIENEDVSEEMRMLDWYLISEDFVLIQY